MVHFYEKLFKNQLFGIFELFLPRFGDPEWLAVPTFEMWLQMTDFSKIVNLPDIFISEIQHDAGLKKYDKFVT
jgi:hypothetical protein